MDSPSKSYLFGVPIRKTLFGFILLLSLAPSSVETQISDQPTAYQMLEQYDFPRGILPQGVRRYVLNQDGSFEVYLSGDCEFKVTGGYLLHYKRKITGAVASGSLTNLRGVSVKVLFLWFGIDEVVRSGDEIDFYVGPLSASFGLSNFEECPRCRCGFDCSAAMVSDSYDTGVGDHGLSQAGIPWINLDMFNLCYQMNACIITDFDMVFKNP